jgi:hypothetical protein
MVPTRLLVREHFLLENLRRSAGAAVNRDA